MFNSYFLLLFISGLWHEKKREADKEEFEPLCMVIKDILDKKVENVVVSSKEDWSAPTAVLSFLSIVGQPTWRGS